MENQNIKLRARELVSALPGQAGGWVKGLTSRVLMYMPAGKHTISCAADEGFTTVTVQVDDLAAPVLNASLAATNARIFPQRCFIDKEHEGKEATAWPEENGFFWSETSPDGKEAPGIYCRAELTAFGREMVEGKVIRAFSPSFKTDADFPKTIRRGQHVALKAGQRGSVQNPARIIGVVAPDIGTLTNQPAFKRILPLWAKEQKPAPGAVGESQESGTQRNMKLTEQQLTALRNRKSELDRTIPSLRAKDQSDAANAEELQAAENELESVDTKLRAHDTATKNETLENELLKGREKDAKAAIRAAVKRGAIPAKNETLQQEWERRLIQDPSNQVLLDAIGGSPALSQSRISITDTRELRASTGSVLRQYLQEINEKKHREASSLYAREIMPRLAEGDDIPLRAADVTDSDLGTLAGTLVSQRVLDLFQLEFEGIVGLVYTDFSDGTADFGGTTITRAVVTPAVENYDATNGWVLGTAAKTVDVPVTMDKHRGVLIEFGANMLASTARRLFDEQAPQGAYALTKDVVDNLYSRITPANFADNAAQVVAEIDFGRRTFGTAGRIFNPLGVPMSNRFALLNSDYHDALEQDPTVTNLAVQQASREGIITQGSGRMPKIKNFQPIEAPNLTTAAGNNVAGFYGHKSSLVIKSRVPSDYTSVLPAGGAHGVIRNVQNALGLTAMVVFYADHDKGKAKWRTAIMYGTAKGYTKGGWVVKSAA